MSLTVIVKPTHDCNISCRHCYIDEAAESGTMTESTLYNTLFQSSQNAKDGSVQFIWHGGEPLLMGLGFYQKVSEMSDELRAKGYNIGNSIQTNGILITDEWLDFIEEERDFRLGLSLDGPKEISDATRVYCDGTSAFDDILRGIRKVKSRKQGDKVRKGAFGGGAIVTLNRHHLGRIKETYDFFKSEEINMKVNPLVNCGRASLNEDLRITPKNYGDSMVELFDLWVEDYETIDIEPFTMIMGNLLTGKPVGCNYSTSCRENYVSIGPNGEVYPCGRFNGNLDFLMGNVNDENGLTNALNSQVSQNLFEMRQESSLGCGNCDYIAVCNGGCMHNAFVAGDIRGKDEYCFAYKKIFNHVAQFLDDELSKAEVTDD